MGAHTVSEIRRVFRGKLNRDWLESIGVGFGHQRSILNRVNTCLEELGKNTAHPVRTSGESISLTEEVMDELIDLACKEYQVARMDLLSASRRRDLAAAVRMGNIPHVADLAYKKNMYPTFSTCKTMCSKAFHRTSVSEVKEFIRKIQNT